MQCLRLLKYAILASLLASAIPGFGQSAESGQAELRSGQNSVAASPTATEHQGAVDFHAAQNPVASVISVPFQNNTFYAVGPYERTANVLVIQPVLPFRLNDSVNLITRWVTPIINLPQTAPQISSHAGLGNLQPEFYFSPSHAGKVIWGAGPKLYLPTATDKALGVNKWGGGPALAGVTFHGPWVGGALANNVWAGSGNESVNQLTLNPFVDFNMKKGWYLVSAPVITADWHVDHDRWTVPLGLGIGRVFRLGSQHVNARVQFLNNVVRPSFAPSWQFQSQLQLMFPQSAHKGARK